MLQDKREQAVLRYHPWIFSGAIKKVQGDPQPGETITILDNNKNPLAVGAYSPLSQIRVRVWDFDPNTSIDSAFFQTRLQTALERRRRWLAPNVNSFRLINSEADGLPGIVIDVYGQYVVLQCLSAGAYFWRSTLIDVIPKVLNCRAIVERMEGASLSKEGLQAQSGVVWGSMPDDMPITINEHDILFRVDILRGQKTGFYLDQRDNRQLVKSISSQKRVLNCFAYTGGFGIAALAGGAKDVTHIEASAKYAESIHDNVLLNNLDSHKNHVIVGDVFEQLRLFQERKERFDLIILDPPKFADSKHRLVTACRGYKDINRLAMELLNPEGSLLTFSCSGAMQTDLFSKVIADAAIDAKRQVLVRQRLWQACDHTINICFPEGLYLKGLWCEV
ncbi:MAG: class I SAM-dependent rRNA methyltransferase [Gammaproteobacteria bacterium]